LSDTYIAEVDTIDAKSWCEQVAAFSDANLYQVWQHESLRERFTDVGRLLLRHRGEVVAAAEVRLFVPPFTRRGIAYIRWGPLWKRTGAPADSEHFRHVLRALRNEYAGRRGMVLRINPRLFAEEDQECVSILENEGFSHLASSAVEQSLVMDLAPSLDELRAGFDKKWRNHLSKAERAGLTVREGTSAELFDRFEGLYGEMLQRKLFVPAADFQRHRRLQAALPENLKMGVVLTQYEGEPCAGAVYTAVGDTALYLFGATNDAGMRTSGSYLAQWQLLKLLKQKGIRQYDLHGISIESNPGTYRFKKGLAGKHGREVTFVGRSQVFEPSIMNYSLLLAERLRERVRTLRAPAASSPLAPAPDLPQLPNTAEAPQPAD
jgi:lipid II:glycine glycyltransferase (peptidoglycan interpeptide bridge formation enzyme)